MTTTSLSNKSLAEQCFENPYILEKIIRYSDPNSMCTTARLSKSINQIYKVVNKEDYPESYGKRIQEVFTHSLSEREIALALSTEKYLKMMEERKSSGKFIPSLENPFGVPISLVEKLLNLIAWTLGHKPEEPDISKVRYTAICRDLVPPRPEAVLLDHSTVLAISPGFINREIVQTYLTRIKKIKSSLSSFIKNERLFEFRALMKSPRLNSDILDDILWKTIQDTRILERFDEYELSERNANTLFDEIFEAPSDPLKELYRINVAIRIGDRFWKNRLFRDLGREGIQREWTYELYRQGMREDEDLDAAFEEIKKVYRGEIWSIEELETEPEDTRLLEEAIKSRSADIEPIILDRVCIIAMLNIEKDNNTRLLEILIEFYGCDPKDRTFATLEYLLSGLINTGHNRIRDFLSGLNGTNELLKKCTSLITSRNYFIM